MKKLYSLLVSGAVAFSALGSTVLVSENQSTNTHATNNTSPNLSQNNTFAKSSIVHDVYRALKRFTATQPLQLPFLGGTTWAPRLTYLLRDQLLLQDSTHALTRILVNKITFG